MPRAYINAEWEDKRHEKDPNHFWYARVSIYAPEESDLYEMTLTYIKKLDNNGAWDFEIQHIEAEHRNIITFKWNGGICTVDAIAELKFHCEQTVKTEWGITP